MYSGDLWCTVVATDIWNMQYSIKVKEIWNDMMLVDFNKFIECTTVQLPITNNASL